MLNAIFNYAESGQILDAPISLPDNGKFWLKKINFLVLIPDF